MKIQLAKVQKQKNTYMLQTTKTALIYMEALGF